MTKFFKNIFIFSFSTGFIPRSLHSRSTRPWITHDGTYESRLVDIKLKKVMNFPGRPGICWSMHIPVSPRSWASTESPKKLLFFYPKQMKVWNILIYRHRHWKRLYRCCCRPLLGRSWILPRTDRSTLCHHFALCRFWHWRIHSLKSSAA